MILTEKTATPNELLLIGWIYSTTFPTPPNGRAFTSITTPDDTVEYLTPDGRIGKGQLDKPRLILQKEERIFPTQLHYTRVFSAVETYGAHVFALPPGWKFKDFSMKVKKGDTVFSADFQVKSVFRDEILLAPIIIMETIS